MLDIIVDDLARQAIQLRESSLIEASIAVEWSSSTNLCSDIERIQFMFDSLTNYLLETLKCSDS